MRIDRTRARRRRPNVRAVPMLVAAACTLAGQAHAGRDDWKDVANIGEAGLVTLAFGKSAAERDWSGGKQLAFGLIATEAVTQGLKATVRETRPDRSDNRSFPSGHTSVSFAAAGYLHQRYGWRWGAPATLAATLVGVSRVQSKDHHWYDVVAGAFIGEASAFLLTKPYDSNVVFLPWADSRGGGVVTARF